MDDKIKVISKMLCFKLRDSGKNINRKNFQSIVNFKSFILFEKKKEIRKDRIYLTHGFLLYSFFFTNFLNIFQRFFKNLVILNVQLLKEMRFFVYLHEVNNILYYNNCGKVYFSV